MTTSDLTPTTMTGQSAPADTSFDTPAQGIASLFEWGRTATDALTQAQERGLAFLHRKQERDVAFMGALASAQNPMTAMGTVAEYMQASLIDWMSESTRRMLDLPQAAKPAPVPQATLPTTDTAETDRAGFLAGPISPIPGAPDSAPALQAEAPARAAYGAKSRSTPV